MVVNAALKNNLFLTNNTDVAIHFWSYENFARDLQELRFLSYLLGMDIDLVFQNLTGSHIVLSAGLCGPDLLRIIREKLIITENKKYIMWETNITVDLNVLWEAIIERKYFKGQVQVSCFLTKMFSNKCDLFFYHQNVSNLKLF